jgi:hypothetical protein
MCPGRRNQTVGWADDRSHQLSGSSKWWDSFLDTPYSVVENGKSLRAHCLLKTREKFAVHKPPANRSISVCGQSNEVITY